jgi:hypothetical protein
MGGGRRKGWAVEGVSKWGCGGCKKVDAEGGL